ncbi:hypothetical protein [Salinisphaera sp.]|uniref:hypothetical protein n=1 Tax=Salinisphaera sp. TaxID=1914330 RepID=UPI0025D00701|nr:hypothetical protein [Salinisphaera sp.]
MSKAIKRYIADLPEGRSFRDADGRSVRTTPGKTPEGRYYYGTREDGTRIFSPDYWLMAKPDC